jgi:biopolymer transport protein ExbB/TolQ
MRAAESMLVLRDEARACRLQVAQLARTLAACRGQLAKTAAVVAAARSERDAAVAAAAVDAAASSTARAELAAQSQEHQRMKRTISQYTVDNLVASSAAALGLMGFGAGATLAGITHGIATIAGAALTSTSESGGYPREPGCRLLYCVSHVTLNPSDFVTR